jgi:plasmid stability protein
VLEFATLYVQNIPTELYEALRRRARANRKSIAAEVLLLLEQNVVTAAEQRSRQKFLREVLRLRSRSAQAGHFPATEEMQREDRLR